MLPVTKIQHFCTKDGPGIRTTVFLKGCPLRCVWCHNPEAQSSDVQFFYSDALCMLCGNCVKACTENVHRISEGKHFINRAACKACIKCTQACPTGALESCSRLLSAEYIFDQVMKDSVFYASNGGVTFSGGEPTVHIAELLPLLKRLKYNHINTAIETCGYFDPAILPELVNTTDLFLWDIKDTDNDRHMRNTGVPIDKIIANLKAADNLGASTVIRCIWLSSVNSDTKHLKEIVSIYSSLKHCKGVELIPYHTYGAAKNIQLGLSKNDHTNWIPSKVELDAAKNFLRQYAVPVINN